MAQKPTDLRIVSLLPAATELACALGLDEHIVGISFECNYPGSILDRPRVVTTALPSGLSPAQIDAEVSRRMEKGGNLYRIDEALLAQLKPDLILTQDLCQVCAPSGNELSQALRTFENHPQLLFLSPHSLEDVMDNLRELAAATGRQNQAKALLAQWQSRIEAVRSRAPRSRPRVAILEWLDPLYCSGHWLAEMVSIAGGDDRFGRPGADSVRMDWQDVLDWQPEILVVAPCGYNEKQAKAQMPLLTRLSGWSTLPAVKTNRVHIADADAFFVRPGPRLIDGLEILSEWISGKPAACGSPTRSAQPANC